MLVFHGPAFVYMALAQFQCRYQNNTQCQPWTSCVFEAEINDDSEYKGDPAEFIHLYKSLFYCGSRSSSDASSF